MYAAPITASITALGTASLAFAASLGSAVLASAGCAAAADRARDQRRMIAALAAARDAVCACPDLRCADAAEAELADYLLRRVDGLKKIPAPRPDRADAIATEAAQLDGELRACKHRLEEARAS